MKGIKHLIWDIFLTEREKSKRTIGVGFDSEEALQKAYDFLDKEDLPYEMILEEYALAVPNFVRNELKKAKIGFYEFKYHRTAFLNEEELDSARKEIRKYRITGT